MISDGLCVCVCVCVCVHVHACMCVFVCKFICTLFAILPHQTHTTAQQHTTLLPSTAQDHPTRRLLVSLVHMLLILQVKLPGYNMGLVVKICVHNPIRSQATAWHCCRWSEYFGLWLWDCSNCGEVLINFTLNVDVFIITMEHILC